jgi:hypothetical protein
MRGFPVIQSSNPEQGVNSCNSDLYLQDVTRLIVIMFAMWEEATPKRRLHA